MHRRLIQKTTAAVLVFLVTIVQGLVVAPAAQADPGPVDLSALTTSQGLSPAFDPAVLDYAVSVPNDVTTITVSATPAPTAEATISGSLYLSGDGQSATFGLDPGDNVISILVTSPTLVSQTYTITVQRDAAPPPPPPASNADLSSLAIDLGAASPVPQSPVETTTTISVSSAVAAMKITPTVADPGASLTINGAASASGSPTSVWLWAGNNVVTIVVTAPDHTTTKTYTITVIRAAWEAPPPGPPSTNADLGYLMIGAGTPMPLILFPPVETSTVLSVANRVTSLMIRPALVDPGATVAVHGMANYYSDVPHFFELSVGDNVVTLEVTAADRTTTKTYTIAVHRDPPPPPPPPGTNAELSSLIIDDGLMPPGPPPVFPPPETETWMGVSHSIAAIKLTPTVAEPGATLTVNGVASPSGSPVTLGLNVGANVATILVTSVDQTTTKTYTVTVTREDIPYPPPPGTPSPNADIGFVKITAGSTPPRYLFPPVDTNTVLSVDNQVESVTVTPTLMNPWATVTVGGQMYGTETSFPFGLNVGDNLITLMVTAQDLIATKTYTILVNRAAAPTPTAPELVSAHAAGTSLSLGFSAPLDAAAVPDGSAFAVQADGAPVSLAAVAPVAIEGDHVTLTLASALAFGQAVTVSYAVPGANALQGAGGGTVVGFVDHAVANDTLPAPEVTAIIPTDASSLAVTFSQPLTTPAGQEAAFTVTDELYHTFAVTGTAGGAGGNSLVLTTADLHGSAGTLTVAYDAALGTLAGVPSFAHAVSPAVLKRTITANQPPPPPLEFTGISTHWSQSGTQVELLDPSGHVMPGAAQMPQVIDSGRLGFYVLQPLPAGLYQVRVTTGAEVLYGQLEAQLPPRLSVEVLTSGYQTQTLGLDGGTVLTFDSAALPSITILGQNGEGDFSGKVSSVALVDAQHLSFTLADGLPTGAYLVGVTGPGVSASIPLRVDLSVSPNPLISGYALPAAIAVTGTGTHFGPGTSVRIFYGYSTTEAAPAVDLQVLDAEHLTFNLGQQLYEIPYVVEVTTPTAGGPAEVVTADWAVKPPPGNLQAVILNTSGQPLVNAAVEVRLFNPYGPAPNYWGITKASGLLELRLPSGTYVVSNYAPPETGQTPGVTHQTYLPFTIESDTDPLANPQTLQLPVPNAPASVVDDTGAPFVNARVQVVGVDGSGGLNWNVIFDTMTDSQGHFDLTLPLGTYEIHAVTPAGSGWRPLAIRFLVDETGLKDAAGQPMPALVVTLPADNLHGQVTQGGAVVPRADIELRPVGSAGGPDSVWARTDDSGNFTVLLPGPNAYFIARVYPQGGTAYDLLPDAYVVDVPAAGPATPATVQVQLPLPNVHGHVRDASDQPVSWGQLRIEWTPPGGVLTQTWVGIVGSADPGAWSAYLPDGSYTVTGVSSTSWIDVHVEFVVSGGVASPVDVIVRP